MAGLFGGPKTPEVKPPTPIVDEEVLKRKRKENIIKQKQRSGRASTILSDKEELG
ncbi:hypothetical protein KA005_07750 [bacterium]|nr:hypothetical protein [bacterium]